MNTPQQIAKHLRDAHFGGNWTDVHLKKVLSDVSWEQATASVYSFNTIAVLVYHMNYYVSPVINVLRGEALRASDKSSFEMPPIRSAEDWDRLLEKTWADAEALAALIEELPERRLGEIFTDEKYGTYYRNLHGFIEHLHYHMGQIVLIKKILQAEGR